MYTPHTWTRGETITSALLNHMEAGIEAAQAAADRAGSAQETRAALDLMNTQVQAALRDLEKRLAALEAP